MVLSNVLGHPEKINETFILIFLSHIGNIVFDKQIIYESYDPHTDPLLQRSAKKYPQV